MTCGSWFNWSAELWTIYFLFCFGLFESLLAHDFYGRYFAVLHVLDFVASGEPTLAEELPFSVSPYDRAVSFVGPLFNDFRLDAGSSLAGKDRFILSLCHFLIVNCYLNL